MLDFDFKKRHMKEEGHCFNGKQQKVIEMKGIATLVKVDEM